MSLNGTGEVLATIHVDSLGVYLWCNRAVHVHVSLRPLAPDAKAPDFVQLPSQAAKEVDLEADEDESDAEEDEYKSPEQLGRELITLSTLSTSRWLNVLELDIIKRRNKPKEAPKAPKAAPFFLPTVPALEFKFDLRPALGSEEDTVRKSVPDMARLAKLLAEGEQKGCVEFLKNLGPSGLDAEILSLAPEGGGSVEVLGHFVDMVRGMMADKRDFELAQTYLALFLKHHADQSIADSALSEKLGRLDEWQRKAWDTIEHQMLFCLSVTQALKGL